MREVHVMTATLSDDGRTVRYTCTRCARCIEDGPDGLKVLARGDHGARHRGGQAAPEVRDIDADDAAAAPPPVLH